MSWAIEDIKRLIELESHQRGIDPRLGLALAEQESGFDPRARSPKGAMGIFQLMPGTARQLKVDPSDVAQNISGGLDYLKQQLDAFGGDPAKAIAAYNAGPGVVQAYKGVPPYKETRGLVSRVLGSLGPASAQAATPQAQPQAAGMSRLQELEAHLAQLEGRAAPQAAPATSPTPPTARSTPEQDAAYRASRGQQEGATAPQTPSPTITQPGASQGPYTPSGERQPSDLVIDIEKPAEPQATGGVLPLPPPDKPLEESLTAPSTLIPLLMGGAGIKAGMRVLGEAAPWAGRLVRPIAEGLSQTLGFGTGRTLETGKLPSPGELATELAVTTATGRVLEDIGAIGADFLRRSKGGKAIMAADEATKVAQAKWQAEVDAATEAAKSQQKDLYDTAVIKARAAQREYEMAALARRETIARNQTDYDQAVRAEQESRYATRRQEIGEQQADYQTKELARTQEVARRQQEYTGAITGQERAIAEARAIPGRYAPGTPSWLLYEKYGDAAKDAVIDLAPAKTALAELRAQRGVLPDGTIRPFPKPVEDIAAKLDKATGNTPFETIRQEIRKLGPLTRSADGNVRGPAKQLMGIYADVLDAAPIANDALKTANATFRREMAVRDMDDWLKPGHGVVARDRYGREKINVPALFKKIDKTMADDSLFRGSFTPAERAALEADISTLAGTPTMPTKPPGTIAAVPVPQPELLPGSAPNVRQGLQTPPREPAPVPLPGDVRVAQVPTPVAPEAPTPTTPGTQLGPRPPVAQKATSLGLMLVAAHELGIPVSVTSKLAVANAVLIGGQQARWLMAHALLDPSRRKLMQAAIDGQGILNPRFYGFMLATLSPEEKKAYQRETGVKR
jgi:hypothetical protein